MAFLQAVIIVVARESLSAFNRRGCRVPGTFRPLQSRDQCKISHVISA